MNHGKVNTLTTELHHLTGHSQASCANLRVACIHQFMFNRPRHPRLFHRHPHLPPPRLAAANMYHLQNMLATLLFCDATNLSE